MRICHVSPHLPPDQAANALLPAQLGSWQRQRGDQVSFITHEARHGPDSGPRLVSAADIDLIGTVYRVPRRRRRSLARALRVDAWLIGRQITAALDELAHNVDLLHLHSNGLIVEIAAAWARRRRVPYVLTLYGTEIWHYRRRWPLDLFTRAYEGASQVTFYSRRLRDRAKTFGLRRPGLSVIYPPVADVFTPHDDATRHNWRAALGIAEQLVVLNVKRLHPLAGQRFLIDAFARIALDQRDIRLIICGRGSLEHELEILAQTLGIANRVTFTGLLPNDQIARYSAVADVFALPSLLEALPTVAVEALASGTPVVSADHPGGLELRELFGDDVAVVPREDTISLARAIAERLHKPRRARPETARQIDALFRPAGVLAAYDAVYRQAAAAESRPVQ